jgi:hypothetical protein
MADLPKIVSDEEFAKLLEEREQAERLRTRDKWDTAAINVISEPSDGLPESTIEQKFPHVAQHLVAMWPSEACRMYLHKLIVSEREIRQGFPPVVIEDLLMLSEINDRLLRLPNAHGKRVLKPR